MTTTRTRHVRSEIVQGARSEVKSVARAIGLNSMTPAVTQVFRRLHDEMVRKGLEQFSIADIVIDVPASQTTSAG
jgi:hypothetical protein